MYGDGHTKLRLAGGWKTNPQKYKQFWENNKLIYKSTSQSDTIPRYCVREDGLSIINARKITDAKFAIKIQDYDTGEIKFDLPVSKRNIKEVKISADGNWLAFLMHISQDILCFWCYGTPT
ncbi:uncharacterized protein TRIADDRAFT_61450 [Trichoplax adhaerens]|uniref:Dipeptidylpeptidase IV N-terminal domain-containing protein n=1 Tax=Trichoplax adhaerens TaxID=10228 RepID=B3SB08_TRIAD|nr:predicted protein [Trichoplax adhaerens]EDV20026.1 predicted protein [Trichoplax adhaerens]|eukprot:XP_002117410.1 predicted protein [Trichoplax adhaerens]